MSPPKNLVRPPKKKAQLERVLSRWPAASPARRVTRFPPFPCAGAVWRYIARPGAGNKSRAPGVSSSSCPLLGQHGSRVLCPRRVVSQMSMPMSGGSAASPNGAAVRHTPLRRLSTHSMCRRRSPAPWLEGPAAPLAPAECAPPTPDPRACARRLRPVPTARCALLVDNDGPSRWPARLSWAVDVGGCSRVAAPEDRRLLID